MRIGFVTSHFPFQEATSVGGIGTSIKNLSDELLKMGHQVCVFVYGQEEDAVLEEGALKIFKIKNVKIKGLSWFFTRKKIQRIINSNTLDIVECPDWEGISSFINANCPLVIRLNGSDTYFCHLENRTSKFKNRYHEKKALKRADGLISVSKFTADVTAKLFNIKERFTIIPNGINLDNFVAEDNELQHEMTILYFGGIIRKKGVLEIPHYFNRIVEGLPDAKLIIIGKDMPDKSSENPSTQDLMNTIFTKKTGKKVFFKGSIPYNEIKNHINLASVCIFPSFAEALPVSWIEAMALKKAVVTSDVGWSNEIIDDGINGFMVKPTNHEAFSDRILQLLLDESLRISFGENARKTIEQKFSTAVTAKQSLDFYNKIINAVNG